MDVKISEPEALGIELKCRGNFGSNATLSKEKIFLDINKLYLHMLTNVFWQRLRRGTLRYAK